MNDLQVIITAVPILLITSFVQLFKMLGMPSKYSQALAFGLAILFAVLFFWNSDITNQIVAVLMYGLSAVGLWEVGGKKVVPEETQPAPIISDN